jgi:hypothetical protein
MIKTIAIIFGILLVIVGVYLIWQSILIGLLSGYIIVAVGGSFGAGFIMVLGILIVKKVILKSINK